MEKIIDWESSDSHLFLNPRHPLARKIHLKKLPHMPGHIWLATSGSTGSANSLTLVALSKEAFLASAQAVNQHLDIGPKDIWVRVLPRFHVGALSLESRAFLSQSKVIEGLDDKNKWNPLIFNKKIMESHGTHTSLVPTQVYDLVRSGSKAPKSLRAVVVGGDALSKDLYRKGRQLGWNLLPTYGCTECSSQVATASLSSLRSNLYPRLQVLPHFSCKTNAKGFLQFKGSALFTGYASWQEGKVKWNDPKIKGWWISSDRGKIQNGYLNFLGREEDFVKVGGENVSLKNLRALWMQFFEKKNGLCETILIAFPDGRLGKVIHLATTKHSPLLTKLVDEFNQKVLPFEKIRKIHRIASLPKTPLGKLKLADIMSRLGGGNRP
ncbi:MAG: hypothetical protein A2W61_01245 [Deltaproteobacteria bacterium RIFCSPLOWO2_01_44_7]|nr:MAG: hypothetical protein A2712_00685 [Deltaproteobacteria bacterium RIFCSPHIGHO2_01_FULL_43_49]OGQ14209.1 MAG: hypothetical protein A3D22_09930 [Deltaproteobacteria bacterium RIFCSPHIGHO2_02_FULL_44_53]OGQ27425.1 MAG: hypothetical protein A3D98_03530 [Deltaproteobacteria bacterium RIFCSPHIGHO2_12_FULL_44_21]OGQ30673.1 MAG: hypothetical protein A2979_05955 [Deltaproteobacteria bacterium RIFCSPLOWO2_01_FULL_45_74]OGQ37738.1 MAG: hypothetical protein A2W61_01245 [Deltaproteobacteria bacterium 